MLGVSQNSGYLWESFYKDYTMLGPAFGSLCFFKLPYEHNLLLARKSIHLL